MDREIALELRLTADEAIVLSDWLYKWQDEGVLVDDEAVRAPLRTIGAALEKKVAGVFAPDYAARVEAARQRLLADRG
jgi:hypothetical protein